MHFVPTAYNIVSDNFVCLSFTGTSTNDVGYGVAVSVDRYIYVTGSSDSSLNSQPYAGI